MTDVVARWRAFEEFLRGRELGWALHYAPAQLRYARHAEHPHGGTVERVLPADYRAFVAEVGYPVLGVGYYDRDGVSFLPPEAMASLSVYLPDAAGDFPEPVDGSPTDCPFAFFAGYDLSEVEGYAFGPDDEIWLVERGTPVEPVGSFTEWLDATIAAQEKRLGDVELLAENDGEDDPHRLLDYSLGGSYGQAPYSPDDLRFSWVESQDTDPYTYGLIDDAGSWVIPLGTRFRRVRPVRDGTADVIVNDASTSYDGPWTTIRIP